MIPRLNAFAVAPQLMQAFVEFSTAPVHGVIESALADLVKIRASQLNGCSFCLHMHSRDALKRGESELKLTMVGAWRESPLFDDRERAALAWTEALTRLTDDAQLDGIYAAVEEQFSPKERVGLTMTIALINAWNRINAGFASPHPEPHASMGEG